jgi:hypothetical protein
MKKSMNNFVVLIAVVAFCAMGLSAFAQGSGDNGAYSSNRPSASFKANVQQQYCSRSAMPTGNISVNDTMLLYAATKMQHKNPGYQAESAAQPGPLAGAAGSWYIVASVSLLFLIMVPLELRYRITQIDVVTCIHVYLRRKLASRLAVAPYPASYQLSTHLQS